MSNLSRANQAIIKMHKLGYYISNDGQVFNPEGKPIGKKASDGYVIHSVRLGKNTNPIQIGLHRYVAYIKYGDVIFEKGVQCRHLNDIKSDNRPSNICMGTAKDNYNDRIRNGIDNTIRYNRREIIDSYNEIGFNNTVRKYGISKEGLRRIVK